MRKYWWIAAVALLTVAGTFAWLQYNRESRVTEWIGEDAAELVRNSDDIQIARMRRQKRSEENTGVAIKIKGAIPAVIGTPTPIDASFHERIKSLALDPNSHTYEKRTKTAPDPVVLIRFVHRSKTVDLYLSFADSTLKLGEGNWENFGDSRSDWVALTKKILPQDKDVQALRP